MFAVSQGGSQPPRVRSFLGCLLLFITCLAPLSAQVNITTQRYDNSRSGLNLSETLLTPGNVNVSTFGKLFTQPVDGAIVGHPLFLSNVSITGRGTHNVVFAATMHDTVYAFDAVNNTGTNSQPLWQTSLADPAHGITSVPIADQACSGVNAFTEIGALPTMVADTSSNTLYVAAKTEENGAFVHKLHALNILDGKEKFGGPVKITASVVSGGVNFTFKDQYQMPRPGLVLVNGVVYVTFGTLGCKHSTNATGWVMAYDASTLAQKGVFTTNPRAGYGGGVWQGGVAPAVDSAGNLYFSTADGPYDADQGGTHYGDSVVKLQLQGTSLNAVDYFTPYNEDYLNRNDLDLGSGGVILLPDQAGAHAHEAVAVGKEGSIYVLDRDNMGKFNPSSNSQIVQFLPFVTGEVDGVPLYWNNLLFVGGEEFPLEVFSLNNGQISITPIYQSSISYTNPVGLILSANGNTNAVLWAMDGQGAATKLLAFDALSLNRTYSTADNSSRDSISGAPHFVTPVVANGRVYLGSTGKLIVYGLLKVLPLISGNNQTGTVGTTLPAAVKIQATDPYGGSVSNLSITFSDSSAGGTFNPPTAKTDSSGFASTLYTLPTAAKTVKITASTSGFSQANFTETAAAGAATAVKTHTGYNQTAPVNTTLPAPISAAVKDAFNNAVPGVVVTFDDGGAKGKFSSRTVTTNAQGFADVTYTTPATAGVVYVTATVNGVATSARFKETVTGP